MACFDWSEILPALWNLMPALLAAVLVSCLVLAVDGRRIYAEDVRSSWLSLKIRPTMKHLHHRYHHCPVVSRYTLDDDQSRMTVSVDITAIFHAYPSLADLVLENDSMHIPLILDGSLQHLILPLVMSDPTSQIHTLVQTFCSKHDLIPLYCATLLHHTIAVAARKKHSPINVCIHIGNRSQIACLPIHEVLPMYASHLWQWTLSFSLPPLSAGTYSVKASIENNISSVQAITSFVIQEHREHDGMSRSSPFMMSSRELKFIHVVVSGSVHQIRYIFLIWNCYRFVSRRDGQYWNRLPPNGSNATRTSTVHCLPVARSRWYRTSRYVSLERSMYSNWSSSFIYEPRRMSFTWEAYILPNK